jgi:hypothetical protein
MSYPRGPPVYVRVEKEFKMTEAVALYLKGYTQQEIETEFKKRGYKTSRPAISRYISETRQEWRKKRMEDMDEVLNRELAKLDEMERKVDELFEKFNPAGTELEDTFECSKSASEWTKRRLEIMAMRHKLLGLNKPTKLDVESKNENINVREKTEATRAAILSRLSSKFE